MNNKGEVERGEEGERMAPLRPVTLEEELRRNPELREADVALLRDWAEKQPHLPRIHDREFPLFLHASDYSVEAAKARIDFFFTQRTRFPEFFKNRDPLGPDLQMIMSVEGMALLPKTTPEGYDVWLCRLLDTNPSRLVLADLIKFLCMVVDLRVFLKGSVPGGVFVVDLAGVTLGHLARLSPVTFRNLYFCVPDGLILHLKGVHFINVVPFMDKLWILMKPFMKKTVYDSTYIHEKGMETFYKFVPQTILPEDYGGNAPPFLELNKREVALLVANKAYFAGEEDRATDEWRRPKREHSFWSSFGARGLLGKLRIG